MLQVSHALHTHTFSLFEVLLGQFKGNGSLTINSWSTDNHTAVWSISQPTALESNGTVTCYIASVVMNGP